MSSPDRQIKELRSILNAFPSEVVNDALKLFGKAKRARRSAEESGWLLWDGDDPPPKPYEWRRVGDVIQYRMHPSPGEQATASATYRTKAAKHDGSSAKKRCPDCGAEAFPQAVCPKCAKGKAGIRKQWVCGENSDHVFYTE
jgi:hypothetical protein